MQLPFRAWCDTQSSRYNSERERRAYAAILGEILRVFEGQNVGVAGEQIQSLGPTRESDLRPSDTVTQTTTT